jgi:hypothetical protein
MRKWYVSSICPTDFFQQSCHSLNLIWRRHYGRPVKRPPTKKLNPKMHSQCGQEYITSFFTLPTVSLRTGNASAELAVLALKLTGFLQCGHFVIGYYNIY